MMIQRALSLLVLATTLAGGSGCCLDRTYCGDGECGTASPLFHRADHVASCGGCGSVDPCACGFSPLRYIKNQLTCGAGCGELYWDEWYSDPPAACDPCDNHGNWIGPRFPLARRLFGGCNSSLSCRSDGHAVAASCGCGHDGHTAGPMMFEGEMYGEPAEMGSGAAPYHELPSPSPPEVLRMPAKPELRSALKKQETAATTSARPYYARETYGQSFSR